MIAELYMSNLKLILKLPALPGLTFSLLWLLIGRLDGKKLHTLLQFTLTHSVVCYLFIYVYMCLCVE